MTNNNITHNSTTETNSISRRRFATSMIGAGVALSCSVLPSMTALATDNDIIAHITVPRVLGDPNAPITVVEFFSMTCGHCANFHNITFPKVKSDMIERGLIQFEMRPFPLDGLALRGHALARSLPTTRYFPMVKALMSQHKQWVRAEDPLAALMKIARLAGISEAEFNKTMTNRALLEKLVEMRQTALDDWDVSSTPSFVINEDKVLSGNMNYETFVEEINAYGA
jgi:protein-disulfide isomerase